MSIQDKLESGKNRYILSVTLGYVIFALLWIFLSDHLLTLFTDINNLVWLSTAKGVTFVVVTAMLLFFALRFVPANASQHFSLNTIVSETPSTARWAQWTAYVFAIVLTVAIQWTRQSLPVSLTERPMVTIFLLPIILSAAAGGLGPGLAATGLASLCVIFYAPPPLHGIQFSNTYDLFLFAFLIVNGSMVSILCEVLHRALRRVESTQQLQAITLASAGEAIITTDTLTKITSLNAAAERLTGWTQDEAKGQALESVLKLASQNAKQAAPNPVHKVLAAGTTIKFDQDARLHDRNGQESFINMTGAPIQLAEGKTLGVILTCRDVSKRKHAEDALRQAATVFECTQEGVLIADAKMQTIMVNRAFTQLTGYSESEVLGTLPSLLHSDCNNADRYAAIWESLKASGYWQGELWDRRKSGEIFPALISINAVRDDNGETTHYVTVFMDISTLKDSEARLDYLAHHDPLTQLPNRLLLFTQLEHGLAKIQREGGTLGLLMFDLDRFKDVNDSFGHLVGDQLLQQVATRLSHRLRGTDSFARLGGDEFTVLLEGLARPEDAARVAEDIIESLSEPFYLLNNIEIRTSASIGISFSSDQAMSAETLLQQADSAMYRAKESGRGRLQYFSENMTQAARERIDIDSRLRRALEQQELSIHYQPQVDLFSGRILGAEALVRWRDPNEGFIPPSRFIPIAEETGMIREIGEWVMREVCRQGRQWLDAGLPPLTLAVNVSARQINHGNLLGAIDDILASTRYPAQALELELTESVLMEQKDAAIALLGELRDRRIRLAIDDFGTGYSSLAYLKRFPLDVLKIDKSFVDDIAHDQDDRQIIKAIIEMGHTLGFKVLAEGVESSEQLAFLQAHGCNMYQGYFRSKPLPAEEFENLLKSALAPAQ